MANEYVWISVQSDFGLTMAELGRLSSSTDPKLIASTLMALKDIVSKEATESDSQFMSGKIETAQYGNFTIAASDQTKLVMTYIISTDKNRTVDQKFVTLIEDLIRNFGKQLTQFGEISDLVNSGAVLPRSILIQAYLNACTIVRTERKLDTRDRHLKESYRETINDVIKNNETMLSVIGITLGDDWHKNNDLWVESGLLKDTVRDRLFEGVADYVVYSAANTRPDLLLYSANPRAEQKKVLQNVRELIPTKVDKTTDKIIEILPSVMDKQVEKFIKKITLVDLHKAERQLQMEFIRRATKKLCDTQALHLLIKPDVEPITEKFNAIVPKIDIDTAATFIFEGIKDAVPESGHKFIKSFLDGYVEGLGDTTISQTAADMMIGFAQCFVDSKELSQKIKEIQGIEKSWARDLSRFTRSKTVENLQVDSIEDAVLLSNAAGNAIVSTLTEILINEFFIIGDQVGRVIESLIDLYNERGKSVKIASILYGFLEIINEIQYSTAFTTPSYKDIVFANLVDNKSKITVGEIEYQYKNKSYVGGDESYPLYEFMDMYDSVFFQKSKLELTLSTLSLDYFIQLMNNPRNILKASGFAMRRRGETKIAGEFRAWKAKVEKNFRKLEKTLEKGLTRQQLSSIELNPPSYARFSSVQYGEEVNDILIDVVEDASKVVNLVTDEIEAVKADAKTKNEVPKNAKKRIEKAISSVRKELSKFDNVIIKNLEKLIVQIEKDVDARTSDLKALIQPEFDILKYNYTGNDFLPRLKQIKPELDRFVEKTEGIETEDINQLILSITLSLFNHPPESVFESVYTELISGKKSKNLKKILNKVKTKDEMERRLSEGGETLSTQVYHDLGDLIDIIDKYFVDRDGIVSTDSGNLLLNFGRLPINKFPQTTIITDLIKLEGMTAIRETNNWLVALNFTTDRDFKYDDPSVVTFSDGVRFICRKLFETHTGPTFEGLAKVAGMMESEAGIKINRVFSKLKNAIFNTEVLY